MAQASAGAGLKARLAEHGYSLFLTPGRPDGWLVTLRNAAPGAQAPVEAWAATRAEALQLAERLFVNHRLGELDRRIRAAGLQPPFWGEGGQEAQLSALGDFARANGIG